MNQVASCYDTASRAAMVMGSRLLVQQSRLVNITMIALAVLAAVTLVLVIVREALTLYQDIKVQIPQVPRPVAPQPVVLNRIAADLGGPEPIMPHPVVLDHVAADLRGPELVVPHPVEPEEPDHVAPEPAALDLREEPEPVLPEPVTHHDGGPDRVVPEHESEGPTISSEITIAGQHANAIFSLRISGCHPLGTTVVFKPHLILDNSGSIMIRDKTISMPPPPR